MSDTTTGVEVPKKSKKEPSNNVVTLEEVAKELKMDTMKARRMLRNAKVKHKHGAPWEWSRGSDELKQAKAILTTDRTPEARARAKA